MQTIEEYKAYAKQLEAEVGRWHHAYDALMIERNDLAKKVMHLEGEVGKWHNAYDALMVERNGLAQKVTRLEGEIFKAPKQPRDAEIDTLASGSRNLNEAIEAMAAELEELRKHEVQWDLDKARIKELETERNVAAQMCADMALKIAALETELEQTQN